MVYFVHLVLNHSSPFTRFSAYKVFFPNSQNQCRGPPVRQSIRNHLGFHLQQKTYIFRYTANVNRQTTDKLLFSLAIITDENM